MGCSSSAEKYARSVQVHPRPDRLAELEGEVDAAALRALHALGAKYVTAGDPARAAPLLAEALAGLELLLGPQAPETLGCIEILASALYHLERDEEAEAMFRRLLAGLEQRHGPAHERTLLACNNLGAILRAQGKTKEAGPYLRRALDGYEARFGRLHSGTLLGLSNYGAYLNALERDAEAEPLLRAALRGREELHGTEAPQTYYALLNLAGVLEDLGQTAEALELLQRHAQSLAKHPDFGPGHAETAASAANLRRLQARHPGPGRELREPREPRELRTPDRAATREELRKAAEAPRRLSDDSTATEATGAASPVTTPSSPWAPPPTCVPPPCPRPWTAEPAASSVEVGGE